MNADPLTSFINTQRITAKKPNAEIRSRWASRIVTRGLHQQGYSGAAAYLRDYGNHISVAKVLAFAALAETEGHPEIALGFWAAAYTLETGELPANADIDRLLRHASRHAASHASGKIAHSTVRSSPRSSAHLPELPDYLQPSRIITMQPVDAARDREHYINDDAYLGQPKRDGNRVVIIASPTGIWYQSRSTSLFGSPGDTFDRACEQTVARLGTFVLDGERVYLDVQGREHRTGAQAAATNVELGQPQVPTHCVLSIFKALYAHGTDCTDLSEVIRIDAARDLVASIATSLAKMPAEGVAIELVPTARTTAEKRALCEQQVKEGREGEIWIRADAIYTGGKATGDVIVRTKYLTDSEVIVTHLTPTSVRGRPFGAIGVSAVQADGSLRPVGSVGTGFSVADAHDLAARHAATPGAVRIAVRHQGHTESGVLWHARFLSVA